MSDDQRPKYGRMSNKEAGAEIVSRLMAFFRPSPRAIITDDQVEALVKSETPYYGHDLWGRAIDPALPEILGPSEKIVAVFPGSVTSAEEFYIFEVPDKSATEFMLVTDRRFIFCSQGIEKSKIVSFPYSAVTELIEMLTRDFIGTERFTLDSIDAK